MLDRTIAPPAYKIKQCKFTQPSLSLIDETIPLYILNMGTQPVLQIELIFDSGVWSEEKPGVAYLTSNMLLEGTKTKKAHDIAEYIDSYGAMIEVIVNADTSKIVLCTLTKFLEPMLKLLVELITESTYEKERLDHLKQLKLHSIQLDDAKVGRISKKTFKAALYTSKHPYGRSINKIDVENISQPDVYNHYKNILFANCRVLVSGHATTTEINLINEYVAHISSNLVSSENPDRPIAPQIPRTETIIKKGGSQASICMGKILFGKAHPDFIETLIVNTILGGYFGSRLMKNIREKNGYTYGIHSNMIPLKHSGYMMISADVAKEYAEATQSEIQKEIEILQKEPVCKTELKTLKNYLMGILKADMDNPLAVMEKFKSVYLYGLDETYFDEFYDAIYNIDEEQIMALANEHLSIDTMSCIIVK